MIKLNHGWHIGIILLCIGSFTGCSTASEHSQSSEHWSVPDIDTSPQGNVEFHGPFNNQTVSVTWDGLASHEFVRVSFDLLILRTWDGSTPLPLPYDRRDIGPDYFQASMADGPVLLNTTFSNYTGDPGFYRDSRFQNFPSPVPGDRLAPYAGSAAKNTMGYHYPMPGPPTLVPMDATYRLSFLVPHGSKSFTLNLKASGLQNFIDENWGVTNVQITPLTKSDVATPSDDAIATAFATALDKNSMKQPDAVNTLIAGMDNTTAWIAKNVPPSGLDPKNVAEQVQNLSADDAHMEVRESAIAKLEAMGAAVEPYLRDARIHASGEVRARIDLILSTLGVQPISDERVRRVMLATRVLEVIQTPAAMDLRLRLVRLAP